MFSQVHLILFTNLNRFLLYLGLLDDNASFVRDPYLGLQVMVYVKQPETDDTWKLIAETEVQVRALNLLFIF